MPSRILTVALLSLLLNACGQEASDVSTGAAGASPEDITALVTRSLKAWETENRADFLATAHEDLLFAFPRRRENAQGALAVFDYWAANYDDTKVYIHRIIVDGSRFAAEYQFASTHVATSKRTAMGTVAVGEVRDGKIVLLKEYTDGRVATLQEEGVLPLDEGLEPFPWPVVPGPSKPFGTPIEDNDAGN